MRFNSHAIAAIFGLSAINQAAATSDAICDACPEEIVLQADQEGFLEYVISNCVETVWEDGINWLDEPLLTGSECMSGWIASHQTGSPIPVSGDCRTAYQNLIDNAYLYWYEEQAYCWDADAKKPLLDDNCVDNILNLGWVSGTIFILTEFRNQAGFYVGGLQCPSSTVRKLSNKGAFSMLVEAAYSVTTIDPTTEHLVDPDLQGLNGLCYSCYHNFFDTLVDGESAADTRGTVAACLEDTNSVGCIESTDIMNALEEFKLCSGGFDLIFEGPVCTEADVDDVQHLIPAPYFTFTHCAFAPHEVFCETIPSYVAQIKSESDSGCVVCYQDYHNSVLEVADVQDNIDACTGDEGVWSKDCIAFLATELFNFKACSGFELSTVKTTHVAPVVTSTPAATTEEATTMEETTAAPETTKAGSIINGAAFSVTAAMTVVALMASSL